MVSSSVTFPHLDVDVLVSGTQDMVEYLQKDKLS